MPSWMYACRDFNDDASDYLDQDLPFWPKLNLRMHWLICVHCRRLRGHQIWLKSD